MKVNMLLKPFSRSKKITLHLYAVFEVYFLLAFVKNCIIPLIFYQTDHESKLRITTFDHSGVIGFNNTSLN